jgi:putative tricarboxylic transport membrane protein
MSDNNSHIQQRWMEVVGAAFFAIIGAIVVTDSFRTGFRWGADGPEPGYFPFYIGCTLIGGAAWVAFQALKTWKADGGREVFTGRSEFKLVLRMFIPICFFVLGVIYLGIYVAAIAYIILFMVYEGKFSWVKSVAVAVGVATFLFLMFEIWFLVPLPKGPIEALLGY